MSFSELVKKLSDVAQIMQDDDKTVYTVYENLEAKGGEGNYKLSFKARKKEVPLSLIPMGRDFFKDEIKGMASPGLIRKAKRTFEPIYDEVMANKLATMIKRWAETIPKGFIETLGSTLDLPKDESLISVTIKPGEDISVTIDFARIRDEFQP